MAVSVAASSLPRHLVRMKTPPPDRRFEPRWIGLLLFAAALFSVAPAVGETLPEKAPKPEAREPKEQQNPPKVDTPLPDPRPADAPVETPPPVTDEKPAPRPQPEPPAKTHDKPTPRPPNGDPSSGENGETEADRKPDLQIPPRPETSPAGEAACRQRLVSLGARFEERPPLSDPNGCTLPHPLAVTALSNEISVEPAIVVNCAAAEAVARFSVETVSKLALEELGSELKSIQQASGYVCRPRNGTHKLSEHAFGNAFDIASFTLSDGTVIAVTATRNPKQSEFLSKVRTAACGPFKTVLGPGSDADHATHFHLDLAKRRNGSTFCQ